MLESFSYMSMLATLLNRERVLRIKRKKIIEIVTIEGYAQKASEGDL